MAPELKKKLQDRLARIEGQARGISRMIGEDKYCIDVLTQLNSMSSALDGLGMLLLDDHVRNCVVDAVNADGGQAKLDELMSAVKRFARV